MRFFHALSVARPCGGHVDHLGACGEHRLERDVVRAEGERPVEFALILGGDADFEPGRANGGDVGVFEIRLPQMDKIAAEFDGQSPMVVDDELRAMGGAKRAGAKDLTAQLRVWPVLDPQLNQFYAAGKQALEPVGAVEDEVEGIKLQATSNPAARRGFQVIKCGAR